MKHFTGDQEVREGAPSVLESASQGEGSAGDDGEVPAGKPFSVLFEQPLRRGTADSLPEPLPERLRQPAAEPVFAPGAVRAVLGFERFPCHLTFFENGEIERMITALLLPVKHVRPTRFDPDRLLDDHFSSWDGSSRGSRN